MQRRQFLASGAALLAAVIAGCGHPPVVLDMDEATADDIADEVSMTATPDSEEYRVVTSALENGSATRRGRSELFDRENTVRIDDAFYEVSETRLSSREVTVYEVLVDFDPTETTPEDGEIAYDDLPAVDREHLERIVVEDDPPDREGYDIGVGYGTAAEVGDESVLVPEQQYDIVLHDGNRYRVTVDSRTTTKSEYRYEATEVTSDPETIADRVREQYLFTLTIESDAEREVVAEAIDGGYFTDDDAFRSVVDRIREHEGLDVNDFDGTWLLEYENVAYLTYAEW